MTQQICYDVVIRLEEDLHSGTGTGSGSLDAIQITGRNNLPVIRATHIKGLLREAGRLLCEMGRYSETEYKKLFGEEGGWQRSALLMQSLRFKIEDQKNWSHQWTNTSREINSRTPKENTLRTLEYVKAGSRFKGQWILTQPKLAYFLCECLQEVTHLGSSRSRGGGRIFIQAFKPILIENNTESLLVPNTKQTRLRLVLKNLEPLCLPITGFPGNSVPSECYIRGQQLLGALVAYSLRNENQLVAEKLLAGKISIGNAYPLPEQISENCHQWTVLPFPLNIYHEKPRPQTPPEQPWWTEQTNNIRYLGERSEKDKFQKEESEGEKLKRPSDREFLFRSSEQDHWQRYQPKMIVHMRNQTPADQKGEITIAGEKRRDDLFSEEEILEETCFMTEIMFSNSAETEAFAQAFNPLLSGQTWLSLGRGGRPVAVQHAVWLEPETVNSIPKPKTEKLTILLTSDLIARTEILGFYESLDIKVLQGLLENKNSNTNALKYKVYKDTVTVRGFNYFTRLPRAPVLAIRRGSALEITGPTPDIDILRQALQSKTALGERTYEGFGRFELDLPIQWQNRLPENSTPKLNPKIGQQETILKAAKKLADELGENALSKTQWQYLRQQVLLAKKLTDIEKLLEQLTEHTKRKAGEVWTKPLAKIKKALQDLTQSKNGSHENQVLFLDALVRYQFARLKMAESKKHDNK
jgi:CRISPR/Cas system CSM-associated protein Csm3 (group 7 of RAMP superfamily)